MIVLDPVQGALKHWLRIPIGSSGRDLTMPISKDSLTVQLFHLDRAMCVSTSGAPRHVPICWGCRLLGESYLRVFVKLARIRLVSRIQESENNVMNNGVTTLSTIDSKLLNN